MKKLLIMKKYAITYPLTGAIVLYARNKKEAVSKFKGCGYDVTSSDVYLY